MKRLSGVVVALALVAAACTSGGGGEKTVAAAFSVTPGVNQVTVTGAQPGEQLTLVSPAGEDLATLTADDHGQAVFLYLEEQASGVEPGDGYTVRDETTSPVEQAGPFRVLGVGDTPPVEHYERQRIGEGFGYVEMRDGVQLSVMVRFPNKDLYGEGPYPTVIEYSGYSPSNPSSPEPGTSIANLLGFATVGVNMRGTGCSGGVFDIFSPAQQADGYDVVEAIARQPWVLHHKVGMVGLSYSGISQLYVASTRPPSLAAITPLSVIEDPWRLQWPGGIYNSGFARQWLAERDRQAAPGGQSWVSDRVAEGDQTCASNLVLRERNVDYEQFSRRLVDRPDAIDDRRLALLVPNIEVPVYLTGAWQDEQTGPAFATMLDRFTGTEHKRFTLFNGRHPDGYSPMVLTRWYEFLQFYVARRVPRLSPAVRAAAPAAFKDAFGVDGLGFEPDRFAQYSDDQYEEALAAYEAEPQVRLLFESGAAGPVPGAPAYRFEATFDSFPPPSVEARRWYFGPDETLTDAPPTTAGSDGFVFDPAAGSTSYTTAAAHDFIKPLVPSDWTQAPEGASLSYLTAPFSENVVMAGPGYADLWLRTDEPDAHLEVVVSIVQPDGSEYYVQHGLLRASARKVDESRSNQLLIEQSFRARDREPLPAGEWVQVKVPIFPFAQVFRAGSRLRVQVNTPGRDTPLWQFENPPPTRPDPVYEIGRSPEHPSGVVLPTVKAFPVDIPAGFPPCPSLRGQVCRPFVPTKNRVVS
ncbi:CocE/NonD family hydrolase [Rhabdothermincola sediminis]|uniref:CocE/NonD family hydrolase n=1 Tax=Rhabdothermincola sediminis TaxID=2751370 RepID=UPI001AA08CD1|nr:CocE/NonD family hydrolase [Rhabdothermincola sediminis]